MSGPVFLKKKLRKNITNLLSANVKVSILRVTLPPKGQGKENIQNITKTCQYNFDSLKSHFYIVTEAVLTSTHNLCFEQKYVKISEFLSENFQFLEVKFSIHLIGVFIFCYFFTKTFLLGTQWNCLADRAIGNPYNIF